MNININQPFRIPNNKVAPLEIAKEFTHLSMRDNKRRKSVNSRSSSFSSISNSYSPSYPTTSTLNAFAQSENFNENAIVDDEEGESAFNSPMLLATSTENNRLLPSLSTISLLNLNKEQYNDNIPSLSPPISAFSGLSSLSPDFKKKPISRTTSFNHARVSSFHHHRHSSFYQQQRRLSTQTGQTPPTPQIAIQTPSRQIPDTPQFGPQSISGSPSGFMLTGSTLPSSLQRSHALPPSLGRNNSYSSFIMSSPRLMPIQAAEVPMTPLMLSQPPLEADEDDDFTTSL